MSLAIVYGSSTGNTQNIAEEIKNVLGLEAALLDIAKADTATINEYEKLIIGTSTWGDGDLQDDWDDVDLNALNVAGKTIALFGLGDQEGYPDNFCTAMGILYKALHDKGATIVGEWPNEGYDFDESEALNEQGNFVGLALDVDNQEDLNEERIASWVASIKPSFS